MFWPSVFISAKSELGSAKQGVGNSHTSKCLGKPHVYVRTHLLTHTRRVSQRAAGVCLQALCDLELNSWGCGSVWALSGPVWRLLASLLRLVLSSPPPPAEETGCGQRGCQDQREWSLSFPPEAELNGSTFVPLSFCEGVKPGELNMAITCSEKPEGWEIVPFYYLGPSGKLYLSIICGPQIIQSKCLWVIS